MTERSAALYLSSPNNPTGQVLPPEWIEGLVEWAAKRELWVYADEVYEDLVYEVTRTLWEFRSEVIEKHAAGRAIQPEVVVRDTGVAFHPGAVRYYREIGIWPAESDD